ncbi:MAG: dTDP-4-dehydrorhamnose reductase [Nitrosopumilaceae archaeon]
MNMKILVTGSAGLVGRQVVNDLEDMGDTVYSAYHNSKPEDGISTQMDLSCADKIKEIVSKLNPDAIIHLAAITDVDLCEKEKELALKINAHATETLSKLAAQHHTFFVYVSTDYVFDGQKGMRKESDHPNPVDFYGKSKLEGEIALNKLASPYAIARTSTPFGIHHKKKGFPLWVKESLESKKEIPVLVDQFTSPTFVPNLSKMLIEVATRQITGIIHLAGATRISRYDLAELVSDKLSLEKKLLIPTKTDEMDWKAQRPKDSSLDVSLATEILHEKPLNITKGLDLFLESIDY